MKTAHKKRTLLLVLGVLSVTGCATNVDNVKPEDDRETKDEVYAEYLEEKYGDEYPDLDTGVAIDYSLRFCSVLESNPVTPGEIDVWLQEDQGLEGRDLVIFQDVLYTGVKVYCPQNLVSVEHLKPVEKEKEKEGLLNAKEVA